MGKIEDGAKALIKSKEITKHPASNLGFKAIPVATLPTRGWFYTKDINIAIKPAGIGEIRHWSTIEESDDIGTDNAINFIMERCTKISYDGAPGSFKDLKEIDRLYLIFAIRELTFKNGQNTLKAEFADGDALSSVELTKEMISYFEMPDEFSEYYNEDERCFIFTNPENETESLNVYFPSIGVSGEVTSWVNSMKQKRLTVEQDFIAAMQFLTKDWRTLTPELLSKLRTDSNNWSLWKISMLAYVADVVVETVNPTMKIKKKNGEEDVVPLNFRGGLKAIFVIPNPLGRS